MEETAYADVSIALAPPHFEFIETESHQQQQKHLLKAIHQLPKRQREIVYLFYYNNLSYKEIASVMSLEVKTVYNQIYTALETLKKHLSKINIFFLLTMLILVKMYY